MVRNDVLNLHLSTQWYLHSQYKSPRRWTYNTVVFTLTI